MLYSLRLAFLNFVLYVIAKGVAGGQNPVLSVRQ